MGQKKEKKSRNNLIIILILFLIVLLSAVAFASSRGLFGFFGVDIDAYEGESILPMDCNDEYVLISTGDGWECMNKNDACGTINGDGCDPQIETEETDEGYLKEATITAYNCYDVKVGVSNEQFSELDDAEHEVNVDGSMTLQDIEELEYEEYQISVFYKKEEDGEVLVRSRINTG